MAQGEGGGRPKRVFSEEEIVQVEALGAVLSLQQTADYFGISWPCMQAIMERQPDVLSRYKKGKAKAIEGMAKGLIMQAMEGSTAAACFYLKTQAGWKETNITEHAGSVDITRIERTIVDPLLSK